ncbi:glycosyltransferase [Rhodococcus sp. NPDC003382]|uniref:glycosyltransferase n=1 Tax=Rhodococcus sp. HM1 TaxID=2937759 RepID=UPI00200A9B9E|nr:glycosyltransferase [Rhodococcus sp. HM1]MCK8671905.1 glycosyltransferase [Rhodococcus sp. HM1]
MELENQRAGRKHFTGEGNLELMEQVAVPAENVTVVVPVYGDWASLDKCIASLQRHLDPRHDVLLVNDCGPEVDSIESNIKQSIAGWSNFSYHRNATNLGFVRTCNRAVFELDLTDNDILLLNSDTEVTEGFVEEMLSVLYMSEKHGIVCPRSNNATIASVPVKFMDQGQVDREIEYSLETYSRIRSHLPRYSVVPVTPGFCILIKRNLIRNFGLFDEVYGLGYSEENDFCLRINKFGYSSVMANHAIVWHLESRSFTSRKKAELQKRNEGIMLKRYPYYLGHVEKYLKSYIDPVDWFADVIGRSGKIKVLINLHHLPTLFNGTSKNALNFLTYLDSARSRFENVEFKVVANDDAIDFHDLRSFGFPVMRLDQIDELFHIGYCPSQIFHRESLLAMNRYCLKIAFSHLDIIALRSNALLAHDYRVRDVVEDSLIAADKIICISQFTMDDTLAYFGDSYDETAKKMVVVHQGFQVSPIFDGSEISALDDEIEQIVCRGGYILAFGNDFDHKLMHEVIPELAKCNEEVLVLGPRELTGAEDHPNLHLVPGGGLSDRAVDGLIENSALIFFPSAYEGFGLPIAEAAKHRRPLVLGDTEVAREIGRLYDSAISISYFKLLNEIPSVVKSALSTDQTELDSSGRTMDDYSREVADLLVAVTKEEVDCAHLRARWRRFTRLPDPVYYGGSIRVQLTTYLRRRNPSMYLALRTAYRRLRPKS